FDPTNGVVSDPVLLDSTVDYYGVAFSADNGKLYGSVYNDFSPTGSIYQFDLNATAPVATKTQVGSSIPGVFHLKLGPDGISYGGTPDFSRSVFSVINKPNLAGIACDFRPNGISLVPGSRLSSDLPHVVPVIPYDTFYTQ